MPLELEHHSRVEMWTEADLQQLPDTETDDYEFKSSRITEMSNYRNELNYKLCKTASAFWNTGGGMIVVGVDDDGVIDGGIPDKMGKQKLRDWVDQVLRSVVPVGPYTVNTIAPDGDESAILPEHVVLVVAFGESIDLPHMSPDHRYYVRAGAHSSPANHYLVEAIRARRGLRRPMLRGLLREHRRKPGIIELAIIAVSDVPALDVQIMLDPLPGILSNGFSARFPLSVPIIDRENAFTMDIAAFKKVTDWFAGQPVSLYLRYEGVMGRQFNEVQLLDPERSLEPVRLAVKNGNSSDKALKKIAIQLERLNEHLENHIVQDEVSEAMEDIIEDEESSDE